MKKKMGFKFYVLNFVFSLGCGGWYYLFSSDTSVALIISCICVFGFDNIMRQNL